MQTTHLCLASPVDIVFNLPCERLDERAEEWHWDSDALHRLLDELESRNKESADIRRIVEQVSNVPDPYMYERTHTGKV